MRAHRCAARGTLLWLALAGILPAGAAAECAPAGRTGATVAVEIDDRTIRVAAPRGMSYAAELLPMYTTLARNMGAEARAVFWPDSSLAALRAGRPPENSMIAVACVAVFKGESSPTADQAREFFAYEWKDAERILRSNSTDTAEFARVQSVLHGDPDGRNDIPLPLASGRRVGLAIHHIEDRASIQLQVNSSTMQSAGGPVAVTNLRALSTVIVGDRVICMLLSRNLRPTTRAVADLNGDSQTWVKETIAANEAQALEPQAKESSSASSPESYPKLGEYVYVEELPEAVHKVPPEFPDAARKADVSGTVMVQALIGRDGRVKDTRVVESIPALDGAAVAAVRQWEFKPAQAKGKPVSVWVAIPVKFSLH